MELSGIFLNLCESSRILLDTSRILSDTSRILLDASRILLEASKNLLDSSRIFQVSLLFSQQRHLFRFHASGLDPGTLVRL